MQFKELGSLFDNLGEISGKRFGGIASIDNMQNWQKDSFSSFLKLDTSGISQYTMKQIKAKAATIGLSESLTEQALALAKDADFTAKARTGKLTWSNALRDAGDNVDDIGRALLNSGKLGKDWEQQLKDTFELTDEKDRKEMIVGIVDSVDGLSDSFIDLGENLGETGVKSVSFFDEASDAAKGLLVTLKAYAPVLGGIAIAVAAIAAIEWTQSKYTRAVEDAEKAASEYKEVQTELDNINNKYKEQKTRIEELNKLKTDGSITMAQEVELENLKRQNEELETQRSIQENLLKIKQQASVNAAKTAANTEQSYLEAQREEYGGFLGTIMGYAQMLGFGSYTDPTTGTITSDYLEWVSNDTTLAGRVESSIAELNKKKEELKSVEQDLINSPNDKNLQNRRNNLTEDIESLTVKLSVYSDQLVAGIDQCTDANGIAIDGASDLVEEYRDLNTQIANIGKSQREIDLNNLNNLFSSSAGSMIRKRLEQVARSGGTAMDALEELNRAGIDLSSLNISTEGFSRYFEDLKRTASEAIDVINSVDGSVEGVKAAFEGANRDADWASMADFLKQANELFANGKIGTDDFKTATQFMSPDIINPDAEGFKYDADAYAEAWKNAQDKIKRYFDSENPFDSITHFSDDLVNNGLASKIGDEYTWNFETSAEAADKLGLSVYAVETLMKNLESYGAEFDEVMWSGEGLKEYESTLNDIKEIYEKIDDADTKDRLKKVIDQSEIDNFGENLDKLTEDQIIKIKFEYDLANIQSKIDEVRSLIYGGDTSVENFAGVISGNKTYINEQKRQLNAEGLELPVQLQLSEKSIEETQKQMQNETDEKAKIKLQAEIANEQEVEKSLLNAFRDAHPEITPETDTTIVQQRMEEFFAKKQHIKVEADIVNEGGTGSIEQQLQALADGSTITFAADIDGVERDITALKNADGSITYTANVDGVELPVEVTEQDGVVKFNVDDSEVNKWEPPKKPGVVEFNVDDRKIRDWLPENKRAFVKYENQYVGKGQATIADGTLNAHASGTNVAIRNNEEAVVNELGEEGLIRNGIFTRIRGGLQKIKLKAGDIILNHKQVEELDRNGKVTSNGGRGKLIGSFVNGTLGKIRALANGWRFPDVSGSGGGSGSGSSGSNNSSKSNSSSTADDVKEQTEELIDWIEVLLSRVQRAITNLGKTVSAAYKSWTQRNGALTKQIEKVNQEIIYQKQAYDRYIQQANSVGLNEHYKGLVRDGKIDIETITDENLKEQISNFQNWYEKALDCQDAIQDLNDELAELASTKFDHVATEYEDALSTIEHNTNIFESTIDKIETKGYIVSKKMYELLVRNEKANIDMLANEYQSLNNMLEEAMRIGNIEMYSEQWYELQGKINDVKEALLDANVSLEEYKNSLREVDWTIFDKTQELLSDVQEEADFLIELMSDEKLFNEKGLITDEGRATMGLHATNYNAYLSQANDYAEEIRKIEEELAKDPYNTDLLERRQELLDSQRDMIAAAEDEKQAIKDLMEEGYNALLNYMDELGQKRMKMLQDTKDLLEYEREIEEQTREISNLQKQLDAYNGDDSEESKATVQQLKVQLEEAEENLKNTEYEKYLKDQQEMLDSMQSETEEWINQRLDNIDLLMQTAIDMTNENAGTIKETLETEASEVGYTLSDAMTAIWSPDGTFGAVVVSYSEMFDQQLTTVNRSLDQIRNYISEMVEDSNALAEEEKKGNNPGGATGQPPQPSPSQPAKPTQPSQPQQPVQKSIGVGSTINASGATIYADSYGQGGGRQYFASDPIYTVLSENNGYILTRHHSLSSGYTGWFKKTDVKAYKNGGLVDETGLAWLDGTKSKPEMVLDAEDTKNFIEVKDALSQIAAKASNGKPLMINEYIEAFRSNLIPTPDFSDSLKKFRIQDNILPVQPIKSEVKVDIGDIQMYGVNDPETFAVQLKDALLHNKSITNIIQADTLGVMMGKNGFSKFRY